MPVVNGSGLFGHLRKADEVACALLADFIESDDFNKEQSDDLERKLCYFKDGILFSCDNLAHSRLFFV